DLTSVLYAVEKDKNLFGSSGNGVVTIDNKGVTHFNPSSDGKHSYLIVNDEQVQKIKDYFVNLVIQKPLKYQHAVK
ncbi:MAG: nucleoside hydrolase, partial [Dysgonomonas sp.]